MTYDESRRRTAATALEAQRRMTPSEVLEEARWDSACDARHLAVLARRVR